MFHCQNTHGEARVTPSDVRTALGKDIFAALALPSLTHRNEETSGKGSVDTEPDSSEVAPDCPRADVHSFVIQ